MSFIEIHQKTEELRPHLQITSKKAGFQTKFLGDQFFLDSARIWVKLNSEWYLVGRKL